MFYGLNNIAPDELPAMDGGFMIFDLLQSKTIYDLASPYEVSNYVKNYIGVHNLAVDGIAGLATLRYSAYGDLGLSLISYGCRAVVENSIGIDAYHFQLVINGECFIKTGSKELHLLPGFCFMVNPCYPMSVYYSSDCVKVIVKIPKSAFNLCAIDLFGGLPSSGLLFETDAIKIENDSTLIRALELIYMEAEKGGGREFSLSPLAQYFLSKLLLSIPNNSIKIRVNSRRDDIFILVDKYIDFHIKDNITPTDISVKCNISLRTLYDYFSDVKGIGVAAYIKHKKLRKIYSLLSSPFTKERSVSLVAIEYGFNHLSRFSSEYKTLFGELPSETAKRSRCYVSH